ncbi:MAG: sugar ABC transporter permease [Lachnospiraceae bacterium]|jgi:raffinose/stachyose/melibiose transport system permease protein|nr:sugar ABC transporter permease [Lachnospiraceae bacterium]MCI9108481.1 sugar ABC transporter permease [Lachnospiraceae bacterium]
MKKKENMLYKTLWFTGFAGPAAICFVLVMLIPFIYGMYLTLTDWNGISAEKVFVGVENYKAIFRDGPFWHSLVLTVAYSAVSVILINFMAFVLAYLVTSGVKGQNFFRAGFFTPNLIGGLVLGYIWQFIFARAMVTAGQNLNICFLSSSWLSDPVKAMAALVIVSVWQNSGFMMLIYIAGLTSVPKELTEAGVIDGCGKKQLLCHVILPQMVSSFVICLFLSITRCFMTYDLNLSLTDGGPFGSTQMASMYVYQKAFVSKNYGLGQTEAVMLFLVCAAVSIIQVLIGKRNEVEA